MPGSTEELNNGDSGGWAGGKTRLLRRCIGAAAALLMIATLAWTTRGSPKHSVTLVANATPPAAAIPSFCPAARTYIDKLPLIQMSLSDPSKLPGLLSGAASGTGDAIASAPTDVQADLATITKAIGDIQGALATANNQFSKLTPQQALSLQSPAVSQAIANILRYVNTTCGQP